MKKRIIAIFILIITLFGNSIFAENININSNEKYVLKHLNKEKNKVEDKENSKRISEKRGSITILGEKSKEPKRYKIILKKLYTDNKIGTKEFYKNIYEVPDYAQAIEIQAENPITFNRENIIEANENGKAIFSNLLLGEYEIREESESSELPFYSVKIPTSNSKDEKNFDLKIKYEKLKGGAIEFRALDGEEPVKDMKYGLYKLEENPQESIEENSSEYIEDEDGNYVKKIGKDIITDEFGYISISDLELGKYYVKLIEANPKYIKDLRKTYFDVDALGSVKMNGGIKVGKVISNDIQVYSIPKVENSINDKGNLFSTNIGEEFYLKYKVDIPKNIQEYENIYLKSILNENIEVKEIKFKLDEKKIELENSQNGNEILINLNQQDKLKGKKKIEIKLKAKIKDTIKNKDKLNVVSNLSYSILGETYENIIENFIITPTYGKIKVVNQDKKSGTMIQGSKFSIRQNGKVIKEGMTDTRGILEWDKIPYGEFDLVQDESSNKYSSPYKKSPTKKIKVDDEKVNQKILIENKKENEKLIKSENIQYLILTTVIIGVIIFFINKGRKQKLRRIEAKRKRMKNSI